MLLVWDGVVTPIEIPSCSFSFSVPTPQGVGTVLVLEWRGSRLVQVENENEHRFPRLRRLTEHEHEAVPALTW